MSKTPRASLLDRLLRRRQYRTTGLFLSRYTCSIRPDAASDPSQSATLVDCSLGGASIHLLPDAAFVPPRNSHCEVTLRDGTDGSVQTAVAYVQRVEGDSEGWRIGVSFVDLVPLVPTLTADWWVIFNRRRSLRTIFTSDESCSARLLAPGLSVDVRVHDLSLEGVCLVVPDGLRAEFESVPTCWVNLDAVPGLDLGHVLPLSVRHLSTVRGGERGRLRFGAAWKSEQAAEWEETRLAVVRLVDERQRRQRVAEMR